MINIYNLKSTILKTKCLKCISILNKKKVIVKFLALISLVMMIIPGIALAEDAKVVAQNFGGQLHWGTSSKPTIINPIYTTHTVAMCLQDLLFSKLIRLNGKGKIEPDLAKSWSISDDGLVYTFYIRKGVSFHDGTECTAEDVLFTYEKLVDRKSKSPFFSHFSQVKSFRMIDQFTFEVV